MDVVSELPSLTHAQLSEPSIQLTALPVPYTTDYTFMHNSQDTHNISMPHTTALASCQAVSLRVVSGRVKKSKVTNLISILTLRPSLDYHYLLAIRSRLYTIIIFSTLSGRLTLYTFGVTLARHHTPKVRNKPLECKQTSLFRSLEILPFTFSLQLAKI